MERLFLRWSRILAQGVFLLWMVGNCCSAQSRGSIDAQEALVTAVQANDPIAIERAVMRRNADVNVPGGGGQTPVLTAALLGHLEAVKTLINLGADLTIPESMGYTVMHAAAFQGRAPVVKLLAEHGVDLLTQHKDGYYPIHRACWGKEARHTETVQIFLNLGVPPDLNADNGMACHQMTSNEETKNLVEAAIGVGNPDDEPNEL
jgi:ankyrin repeat protein